MDHIETALSQLQLADDLAEDREGLRANAAAAAQVHALLAITYAVRKAALSQLQFDPSFP